MCINTYLLSDKMSCGNLNSFGYLNFMDIYAVNILGNIDIFACRYLTRLSFVPHGDCCSTNFRCKPIRINVLPDYTLL